MLRRRSTKAQGECSLRQGRHCPPALQLAPASYGDSFNIGSGRKTTIAEVAAVAAEVFSIAGEPAYAAMESRSWDVRDWYSDQKKTAQVLRWKARVDFREGLRRTADWFRRLDE